MGTGVLGPGTPPDHPVQHVPTRYLGSRLGSSGTRANPSRARSAPARPSCTEWTGWGSASGIRTGSDPPPAGPRSPGCPPPLWGCPPPPPPPASAPRPDTHRVGISTIPKHLVRHYKHMRTALASPSAPGTPILTDRPVSSHSAARARPGPFSAGAYG